MKDLLWKKRHIEAIHSHPHAPRTVREGLVLHLARPRQVELLLRRLRIVHLGWGHRILRVQRPLVLVRYSVTRLRKRLPHVHIIRVLVGRCRRLKIGVRI